MTSSRRSGTLDLWLHRFRDGHWQRLTDGPSEDFEPQFSPDGTHLVFTSTRDGGSNIWTLRLRDGRLTQRTFSAEEKEYPSWSPDGRYVIYTGGPWRRRDLFAVPVAGGSPVRLTRRCGFYGAFSFFPDGSAVVYHDYSDGSGNLHALHLGDGVATRLTSGPQWDYKAKVSPDGRWIAFSRHDETTAAIGHSAIIVRPVGPGDERCLTDSPHNDRWPTWDATGDRLFFHRLIDRGVGLKLLDRETGTVRRIPVPDENPGAASIDPSGTRVVYAAARGQGTILRVFDLRDGGCRDLVTGPGRCDYPRWSPDSSRIAFVGEGSGRWDVEVVDASGDGRTCLTSGIDGVRGLDGPVAWSPDSRHVAWHADTEAFEANIYVSDVQGGECRALTADHWFDESPSWSPDGSSIVFMSTRGGGWSWGFFRASLDGREIRPILGPDWVPRNHPFEARDGSILFDTQDERGVDHLAELRPDGGSRVVTSAGPWARWPTCSGDGRLVLFTEVEHRVEYWLVEGLLGPGSPCRREAISLDDLGDPSDDPASGSASAAEVYQKTSPHDKFRR